ncbi:DNA (cytosine-5-)-methyltransferase [uncultured Muribaculum sp.]|uniref:DNA (cytosine-5-)-methyltransferase n=1 Tax=uncultured Muribaculum sp. TaxID=1918613 RepID=UPI0025F58188|nr:DNA (cytosine-5-)-methyltransferase [uncultured Muribaculum sp.]
MAQNTLKFIDLFAGIGGIRKGLELAADAVGIKSECVFTSEIKPYALTVLKQNHPTEEIKGDITRINVDTIPDFDILCAGFPCQAFSAAGNRKGFADTRGTLFFDVERILSAKKPKGFILENVEGLVNHDGGKTLRTILQHLEAIGYKVSHAILNSRFFGVPQERKRIYIVGTFKTHINLANFPVKEKNLESILESGLPVLDSPFTRLLLSKYSIPELYGKSIKDKRGGKNNIHSWDIDLKGETTAEEKELLNVILTERRKKIWAEAYNIDWMDGMPLTLEMIGSFYHKKDNLKNILDSLVKKGYLVTEHPKRKIVTRDLLGNETIERKQDPTLPKGYNIVTGKLSFEINKILDPRGIAPTLVAMDMQKLVVADGNGLRRLTLKEGLRLFGYPEDYKFNVTEKNGFDLLGNTVVVPVIKAVCERLLKSI